jgi:hypothetical protein
MKTGIVFTCAVVLAASQFPVTTLRAQDRKFNEIVTVQGALRAGANDVAMTFSGPVALPGLSLASGTYMFRHLSPRVVQVASASGRAYSMYITIPAVRDTATDDYAVVLGAPAAPGAPRRIVALFAPGEMTGEQFVYSDR